MSQWLLGSSSSLAEYPRLYMNILNGRWAVTFESNCLKDPAAVFRGFEYGVKPMPVRVSLSLVKSDFGK